MKMKGRSPAFVVPAPAQPRKASTSEVCAVASQRVAELEAELAEVKASLPSTRAERAPKAKPAAPACSCEHQDDAD